MAVMAGPNDQTIAGKKTFSGTLAVAPGAALEGVGEALRLGTAALLNAPASGDAAASEVVIGSDSRLLKQLGADWVATSPPAAGWYRVTYGNGRFVAVSNASDTKLMHSSDGVSWSTSGSTGSGFQDVTYGNGRFVGVGSSAAYSVDGINWTPATGPTPSGWFSVTYGNGRFVAVSRYSGASWYSVDGATWTSSSTPPGSEYLSIAFGSGVFIAAARDKNTFIRSTDGTSWTSVTVPKNLWNSIAYGNGRFVAVASGSAIIRSTDGITWTSAVAPTGDWLSVAYGNGRFVALAHNAKRAIYSNDGETWVETSIPVSAGWYSIAYGGGKFVAVGDGGSMYSSLAIGLGLDRVSNTSDRDKPISAATQAALDGKAPAPAHAELTGTAIPWSDGHYWKTISADTTFTFTPLAGGHRVDFDLTTVGSVQPTWPGEVIWPIPGDTPVHPADGNAVYTFKRINGVIKGAVEFYS